MQSAGHETRRPMSDSARSALPNFYEVLEVSPRASQEVVQAAYRALVRNYHPDLNASPDAVGRILQLNAAYAVLGNPEHRARYDLECARARRRELVGLPSVAMSSTSTHGDARRPRIVPLGPPAGGVSLQELSSPLLGQLVLALIVVGALSMMLLVLIWVTNLDSGAEPSLAPMSQPALEIAIR
jgi:curved DNA-binding protein CbpA